MQGRNWCERLIEISNCFQLHGIARAIHDLCIQNTEFFDAEACEVAIGMLDCMVHLDVDGCNFRSFRGFCTCVE